MSHYTMHDTDEQRAQLTIHGVPYADFDRTGHWSVWSISRMLEAARILSLYGGFLDFRRVDNVNFGLVLRKQTLKLNPRLHTDISLFSKLEMKFSLEAVSLGEKSITYAAKVHDEITGEELGENHVRFVRINRKTRKSAEFPEFFYNKFGHLKNKPTLDFFNSRRVPTMPAGTHMYKVTVHSSDTDRNKHCNQAMYIKFCLDCATDAALKQFYIHFDDDMCKYTTTYWEVDYIGESHVGDALDVHTWQAQHDKTNLHFSIRIKDREIFHAKSIFELTKRDSPVKRISRM